MTDADVKRSANKRPLSGHQGGDSRGAKKTSVDSFDNAKVNQEFAANYKKIDNYIAANRAGYENRRNQLGQKKTDIRIISNTGLKQAFRRFGKPPRSSDTPVFRYVPPLSNAGIQKFKQPIQGIVMHSFGHKHDRKLLSKGTKISVDPRTGHNPQRFFAGITYIVQNKTVGVHHMVSYRGDLINSVSWDNRSVHGEGHGGIGLVNDTTIGIEHESGLTLEEGQDAPRTIQDQRPFTEEQYIVDAFIIKKLEAYTGNTYTRYLGSGNATTLGNLQSGTTGCFNHRDSSGPGGHSDPGAEYDIPPGFLMPRAEALNSTIRSTILLRDRPTAWLQRFEKWYSDIPVGTALSAYDRIFEKVNRFRDDANRGFDLASEVFDENIGAGPVDVFNPKITGVYTAAAAQQAARDQIAAFSRQQTVFAAGRSFFYTEAQRASQAVALSWSRNTSKLIRATEHKIKLPVIVDAVGFDFETGTWVNQTTKNQPSTQDIFPDATDTPTEPDTSNG